MNTAGRCGVSLPSSGSRLPRSGNAGEAPAELHVSEGELTPTQRAELDQARSRATTSMVLGIIALAPFGFGLLAILALVAVPIGHKSRSVLRRYPLLKARYGWTRATVGVVLGWIAIAAWLLVWIAVIIYGATLWAFLTG